MGQQSQAHKSSTIDAREELLDDGVFLSPEETDTILSSLEKIDQKLLWNPTASGSDEEGVFIAPEDIEGQSRPDDEEATMPDVPSPLPPARAQGTSRGGESLQSDLLSRIAGELRSIKLELGTLKNTYDDMISKASSISSGARPEKIESPEAAAENSGQPLPQETMADLKKLLGYLDRLLESLPEEKIDEFARSEYFELYRKIFEFLDLV